MTNQRYSPEFKDEAVRQIVERGYSVAEVSKRLGVYRYSYELFFVAGFPTVNSCAYGLIGLLGRRSVLWLMYWFQSLTEQETR
jgi:transposase